MRIILTLATILTCIFNSNAQNADGIYSYTEQMPEFMGEYNVYKLTHLKYPAEARKDSIEGRCVIKFIVDTNGRVENVTINKSVHPILDSEAVRFISTMPKWKPAKHLGTKVNCYQLLVIPFSLNEIGKTLESDSTYEKMPIATLDWQEYYHKNFRYPTSKKDIKHGSAYVKFVINEDGSIVGPQILTKDVPSFAADEIIRLTNEMQPWKPGCQNGQNVKVYFTLPITY